MSYDAVDTLKEFHDAQSLNYPLLRDVDARHVNAYGVRNEAYGPEHNAYGVPHPGVVFVDAQGIVRANFAVPGYRQRPPFEDIYSQVTASRDTAEVGD